MVLKEPNRVENWNNSPDKWSWKNQVILKEVNL